MQFEEGDGDPLHAHAETKSIIPLPALGESTLRGRHGGLGGGCNLSRTRDRLPVHRLRGRVRHNGPVRLREGVDRVAPLSKLSSVPNLLSPPHMYQHGRALSRLQLVQLSHSLKSHTRERLKYNIQKASSTPVSLIALHWYSID